jgi:hypothetical protein
MEELSRSLPATEKLVMRLIALVSLLGILTVELHPIIELVSTMKPETQHIMAAIGDVFGWIVILYRMLHR